MVELQIRVSLASVQRIKHTIHEVLEQSANLSRHRVGRKDLRELDKSTKECAQASLDFLVKFLQFFVLLILQKYFRNFYQNFAEFLLNFG